MCPAFAFFFLSLHIHGAELIHAEWFIMQSDTLLLKDQRSFEVTLTAIAVSSIMGEKSTIQISEPTISIHRFTSALNVFDNGT